MLIHSEKAQLPWDLLFPIGSSRIDSNLILGWKIWGKSKTERSRKVWSMIPLYLLFLFFKENILTASKWGCTKVYMMYIIGAKRRNKIRDNKGQAYFPYLELRESTKSYHS